MTFCVQMSLLDYKMLLMQSEQDCNDDMDDSSFYRAVGGRPPSKVLVFVITAFYDMTYIYSFLLVISINYLATSNNTTQKLSKCG